MSRSGVYSLIFQVIIAFLLSAYITFAFVIISYWTGLIPGSLLNAVDRNCFKAKANGSKAWSEALQKGVFVFADQQIITGIAILIAGFSNMGIISVYHFNIIVYLAWMSSNVHLTSLTLLRSFLKEHKSLKILRVSGMLILLVMLFFALIPTAGNRWSTIVFSSIDLMREGAGTGVPARCFWSWTNSQGTGPDAVFTFLLLVGTYVWKVSLLFQPSDKALRNWLRTAPEQHLTRMLQKKARRIKDKTASPFQRQRYRTLVGLYTFFVATCDFAESFAASLWALMIGLGWGTLHIFPPRSNMPDDVRKKEDEWGFGQVLPPLLLALPLVTVLQHLCREYRDLRGTQSEPITFTPLEPLSIHDTDGNDQAGPLRASEYFLNSNTDPTHGTFHTAPDLHRHLYTSKYFKTFLWSINIVLSALSAIIFTVDPAGSTYTTWQFVLCHLVGLTIWILVLISVGPFFTKLGR